MRFFSLLARSLRLRCPGCGQTKLFRGLFRMNERCPVCQLSFEREQGFYLGAIYFNYGLTALVVAIAYPVLMLSRTLPPQQALFACMAFVLVFPIFFHRFARSLWLGFDQFVDPQSTGGNGSER